MSIECALRGAHSPTVHTMRVVLGAVTLLCCLASRGQAQRGAAPAFDGPRGYLTVDLSDGEPISAFIEISRALELTDTQKRRLMDIRRNLRVLNKPFMARLDSLRELAGVELGDRERIRRREAEALTRFNLWARPVVDSIRFNNDVARAEARGLLSADQRRRFDSIAVAGRDARGRPPRRPGA